MKEDNLNKKTFVTISRLWHNPQITTTISNEGISLKMDMKDFIVALKHELGRSLPIITRKGLNKKVDKAIYSISEGVKVESAKVI